jgi:hypothetical protein
LKRTESLRSINVSKIAGSGRTGMMSRIAIYIAVFLAFAGNGYAATISVSRLPSSDSVLVAISGDLVLSDADEFRKIVADIPKAIVAFRSDGGSVIAAINIGRQIRFKNFATLVPDNTRCASACALAWLGGTPRLMGANTHIGFHAAYNPRSGQEVGVANALVGAYLGQIGLPDKAVIYATRAPPKSMAWLTMSEARQVGIDVASSTITIPKENVAATSNGGLEQNGGTGEVASFERIAGKWCGTTTNYIFAQNSLTVDFLNGSPAKQYEVTGYDYVRGMVVMHWINDGETLYTEFSEFSADGRDMAQLKSKVGPRRPFHRC